MPIRNPSGRKRRVDGRGEPGIGFVQPIAVSNRCGLVHQGRQLFQIETGRGRCESAVERVIGIELLFRMSLDRNCERGFSEARRFGNGFKSRGADYPATCRHVFEKFLPVEGMELECGVEPFHAAAGWAVVEAMDRNFWIPGVPPLHFGSISSIQQINEQESLI